MNFVATKLSPRNIDGRAVVRFEMHGDELAILVSKEEVETAVLRERMQEAMIAEYEKAVGSGEVEESEEAAREFVARHGIGLAEFREYLVSEVTHHVEKIAEIAETTPPEHFKHRTSEEVTVDAVGVSSTISEVILAAVAELGFTGGQQQA